jgi:hypothetical protein
LERGSPRLRFAERRTEVFLQGNLEALIDAPLAWFGSGYRGDPLLFIRGVRRSPVGGSGRRLGSSLGSLLAGRALWLDGADCGLGPPRHCRPDPHRPLAGCCPTEMVLEVPAVAGPWRSWGRVRRCWLSRRTARKPKQQQGVRTRVLDYPTGAPLSDMPSGTAAGLRICSAIFRPAARPSRMA